MNGYCYQIANNIVKQARGRSLMDKRVGQTFGSGSMNFGCNFYNEKFNSEQLVFINAYEKN